VHIYATTILLHDAFVQEEKSRRQNPSGVHATHPARTIQWPYLFATYRGYRILCENSRTTPVFSPDQLECQNGLTEPKELQRPEILLRDPRILRGESLPGYPAVEN
jgi:hypothetical protein